MIKLEPNHNVSAKTLYMGYLNIKINVRKTLIKRWHKHDLT